MIWIKAFDFFDDTNENEKYEKKAKKKERTFLKIIWMIEKVLYKDSSFQIKSKQRA